tara:strand:- start:4070 stop:5497 length:1428 start_codon:yes stop_codon:yes gene_type:complete
MILSSFKIKSAVIILSIVIVSAFIFLNQNLYTSPNDGILYYSISLNILENFSFNSLIFKDDLLFSPQIGISILMIPFLYLFGSGWYIFFIIFLSLIWYYSLSNLANTLTVTLFKNSKIFYDQNVIFSFLLLTCISSLMLMRISTSFYNESLIIPLQIILLSKFLLISSNQENLDKKNMLIFLISFVGIFFRLQFVVFFMSMFIGLYLFKRIKISSLFISLIPVVIYFALFYYLQNNFHVNVSTSEVSNILDNVGIKIFFSINSLAIILNLYFIGLGNTYFLIGLMPLSIIYAKSLNYLYKENKLFSFLLGMTILGNLLFVFIFIPVSFFDDFIRYYWIQLIPLSILLMLFINNHSSFLTKYLNFLSTIFFLTFFLTTFYFKDNIIEKINESLFGNNLKNIDFINEKWNLKEQNLYSEDLKREYFWITKQGTYNLKTLNYLNCSKNKNHFILSKKTLEDFIEIDKIGEVRLYKACN